ncbi:methyltransferase family protein [Burkholderiales bacterium JOSHI_001]|nr:methyltransferase family protein [Burkholderiales bacterium JOSHI_001]
MTPSTASIAAGQDDFISVTERGGEPVSQAQVDRFFQRYIWAGEIARGKDVLELACGTGPGLGHLQQLARRLVAADISAQVLAAARAHYGLRIDLRQLDACNTGLEAGSFDVVILFEAIYYLPDVEAFLGEVARLLRPGGRLLLATANKDLFDFNPSPFSHRYFNPPELAALLRDRGFDAAFFGGSPVPAAGMKTRLLRAAKRFAARHRLIPGSMNGKRLLKRLVFGPLVSMPVELDAHGAAYAAPQPIPADQPDTRHQVLYCLATKL